MSIDREHNGKMHLNAIKQFFLVVVFVVILVPFVGMIIFHSEKETSENLSEFPSLVNENNEWNLSFISELGTYFEDHYAFRDEIITVNSFLRSTLFGQSGTDQVILGKEGFMFYEGTLNDYFDRDSLSDKELKNIAHNLFLMQRYLEASGSDFIFTVAPNKNTLYSQYMPDNYIASTQAHNLERLKPYLDYYGVNYVDLLSVFQSQTDVLYAKTDSHWTNRGALLAANTLLSAMGRETIDVATWGHKTRETGDLYRMVYPCLTGTEKEEYAAGYNDLDGLTGANWGFSNSSQSVEDGFIQTESFLPSQENTENQNENLASDQSDQADITTAESDTSVEKSNKKLYMYRDSFANALIPYISTQFDEATYSKLIPYDAMAARQSGADVVVVERAERHLGYLSENAPLMPSLALVGFSDVLARDSQLGKETQFSVEKAGNLLCVKGTLDKALENYSDRVIVRLYSEEGIALKTVEAFTVTTEEGNEQGFVAYVSIPEIKTWEKNNLVQLDQVDIEVSAEKAGALYGANEKAFSLRAVIR